MGFEDAKSLDDVADLDLVFKLIKTSLEHSISTTFFATTKTSAACWQIKFNVQF